MPVVKTQSSFLSRIFPTPDFLTLDPVSLDISPGAVRIMKLMKTNVGKIPKIYDEIILNEPCSLLEKESDLETCDELRSAIKKLRDTYKLKFVSVSLPELKTYIYKTRLPKEALKTIGETLKFSLEENVPINPQDVLFQYSVIDKKKSVHSDHIDVVVSALPKSVIEMYTRLLKDLDLTAVSFESESHSLARSLVKKDDPGSYLLVHFDVTKVSLAIVEHNVVQYTSSLPIGSDEIIKDLNGASAQTLKEQINKLLVYWFTNKNDPDADHRIEIAILSGAISNQTGLEDFLERGLRLSVKVGDVWQNAFSLDDYIPPIDHTKSLDYATAVGLALINTE